MIARRVAMAMALLCLVGCDDLKGKSEFVPLDRPYFDCEVQPILTKSCSGFRCHGDALRYYTVFTRNRLRFGGTEDERASFTKQIERDYNYTATLAHIDRDEPAASLFLLKPLDEAAGGFFHRGAEIFGGGDVYLTKDERDFETLSEWVNGATADPACIEPGSDQ